MDVPASKLEGLMLEGDWKVLKKVEPNPKATGSTFSIGYLVESASGTKGFLKALDYSIARRAQDTARRIQELVEAFNFERDLLEKCGNRKLTKVVKAIGEGKVIIDPSTIEGTVQYIIFELADADVRIQLDAFKRFDEAWALRSLHQVATGLEQLHRIDIAHQDLKPSNVLIFSKDISKVADLGRAAEKGRAIAHNERLAVAGDPSYAPPELLYGFLDPDWNARRFGCDAYLLGNLITFYFCRMNITAAVQNLIEDHQRWRNWNGSFEDVLPYLRHAFDLVLVDFRGKIIDDLKDDLSRITLELCDPDPRLRGHRKNLFTSNQYSLERYVSELDLIAKKAEIALFIRKK